jgi:hypothetical protein
MQATAERQAGRQAGRRLDEKAASSGQCSIDTRIKEISGQRFTQIEHSGHIGLVKRKGKRSR